MIGVAALHRLDEIVVLSCAPGSNATIAAGHIRERVAACRGLRPREGTFLDVNHVLSVVDHDKRIHVNADVLLELPLSLDLIEYIVMGRNDPGGGLRGKQEEEHNGPHRTESNRH